MRGESFRRLLLPAAGCFVAVGGGVGRGSCTAQSRSRATGASLRLSSAAAAAEVDRTGSGAVLVSSIGVMSLLSNRSAMMLAYGQVSAQSIRVLPLTPDT